MCGFAGCIDFSRQTTAEELRGTALRMARSLRHRGPDDEGVWIDAAQGVALGNRRLAILDLSQAGHQPMVSTSGRFVVVYNGEIYNFQELIRQLQEDANCEVPLRGHSDTEVMLACFEFWGIEASLARMNGMFAFAVWDRQERSLYLCRDRMGEKPLYYGWAGNTFLFGSELKALRLHPAFKAEINREAVSLYLRYNCVPSPYSIFEGVHKLPPGSLLKFDCKVNGAPELFPYWSPRTAAENGIENPLRCSESELLAGLEDLLKDAVKIRMMADVPLGVFLSGGIDSSTITALMQAESARAVRTFSIGSEDSGFNEAKQAAAVARHLGADHTELYVTAEDALSVIPLMPTVYDEPFGDSSQIPTFLLSRLARKHVKAALSGDGGDELFAGYNRHVWIDRIWRAIAWLPGEYRRSVGAAMTRISPGNWDGAFRVLNPLLPAHLKQRYAGYKVHKLARILSSADPEAMYAALVSHWNDASFVLGCAKLSDGVSGDQAGAKLPTMLHEMLLSDALTYLPDDILVKVDRASMAVGLETRLPLLDHRVVEYSWKIPISAKIREKKGKWALREILRRYVPARLTDRPKAGFGIPLGDWLRGPLREWSESLLDERRLKDEGFFNARPIREKWAEHLSGKAAWEYHLWDVLMFQAWLSEGKQSERAAEPAIQAALAS
jgi:asparagine synthase (glutamine-hydrolysing)